MDIDLHGIRSRWPSILRRGDAPAPASDQARATVLDPPIGQSRICRADPARVRDLLSQLITAIEGKPLSDFVPMAATVPLLLGLSPANLLAFDEFLGSFIGTVLENGRTVVPPSVTDPSDSISANRRALAAGALGVKRSASVARGRPRSAKKYNDLVAHFSEAKTLAAVLADADDGLPPATAEVVGAMLNSIRNDLQSGDAEGAREAGKGAAILVAAAHAAFLGGETSGRALRVRGGPVLVRRSPASETSRAVVTHVDFDVDDFVYDPRTGDYTRKKKRKRKLTKV